MSPTLGSLEADHKEIWGTKDYENDTDPTVFMGIYGLPDFYTLWRHKGKKHILWCGTDITYFKNGYWLDEKGEIRVSYKELAIWINKHCQSWVENKVEANALMECGIYANICPSFLGNVNRFEVSFKPGNKVYTSVSGNDWRLYGWDKIGKLAKDNPDIEFHLYGNAEPARIFGEPRYCGIYPPTPSNVIVHGRVPKEQMNAEIKDMQGALRLTRFDGFSEILAKSVLMGQWPVSPFIEYPHMLINVSEVLSKKEPNLKGRKHYLRILNSYPWNCRL